MKPSIKYVIIIVLTVFTNIFSQTVDKNNYYIYPHMYKSGQTLNLMGLSAAKLPEILVETNDIIRTPIFFYRFRYGLIKNFNADASFETNIITYHASLGLKWNYEFNGFSAALGSDIAFWIGRLKMEGFDTKMTGLNLYPNLTFGYAFEKFSVSIKSELILLLDNSIKNGSVEVKNRYANFSGYAFGLYVEQPLWKNNNIMIGFRGVFVKLYYPTWAAFTTFDKRLYITEAVVGLVL